jgi:endonuclease VIII-like 1
MPEIAEVRLTSDYVNQVRPLTFNKIRKNPSHKGILPSVPFSSFSLISESRGKEFILYITCTETNERLNLLMTMGMSGFFNITKTGAEAKHSHLMFDSNQGYTLSFVDVRRFGKWKLAKGWSPNRGPDPIRDFENFKKNVLNNLDKPIFQKPIYEVLMNQTYFNGIGNYLRAEILFALPNINPFQPAKSAIEGEPLLLDMCMLKGSHAYESGGGVIKDWKSPFGETKLVMKCYGNPYMLTKIDSNGRRFWYHPKWQ